MKPTRPFIRDIFMKFNHQFEILWDFEFFEKRLW